ncbi:tyrosine-type recombinase/integrase [Rhodoferax ferrireducens]|uniref:tyrosine-type recombinase/integrase n=1 Tax=Rhodoferax ferrireducens TaxID=192843 RepID=UPI000E0DF03A|nr:tyrosine-type recombinase/integrase [Rhodoferax ferrireducens]
MNTSDVIKVYLAARRAQGVQIRSGDRALRQFARETGDRPLHDVTPQAVATFLRGHGALSAAWTTKFRLLTGLYRFALARGYVAASPMPEFKPKLPPPQTPYVYSHDELQRLLDATAAVRSAFSRLQVMTYRTLLLVLYGAGLRISEAIGLTVADVNLTQRVLTVRNTKFYKTRLVPIGPQLAATLATYYDQRSTLPLPKGQNSAFLCSRSGCRLTYQYVVTLFQRVRSAAGIVCPSGEPRPPRLHDLRHTAAVHRVLSWYRSGKDVQQLLPHLATYLGHACIASTQRYLQMTPELLQEASCRFAAYAQHEAAQEVDHA